MENATKALLIASGVMIGLMILSLGISLYTSMSGYVESMQEEMINSKIQQFNMQFAKFINYNKTTGKTEFTLTIQDIVTAANIAYESNKAHGLTSFDNNNYYVEINMPGYTSIEKLMGLNSPSNSKIAEILESGLGKKYKCSSDDVKINSNTGRIYEVNFHEIL